VTNGTGGRPNRPVLMQFEYLRRRRSLIYSPGLVQPWDRDEIKYETLKVLRIAIGTLSELKNIEHDQPRVVATLGFELSERLRRNQNTTKPACEIVVSSLKVASPSVRRW
jgi:hypothetical protein